MNRTQAEQEIEEIYKEFAGYTGRGMTGCPHCTSPDATQELTRKGLRDLQPHDLDHYAFKAITTWGNVENYKYFLPRILELSLTNVEAQGLPGFDIHVILSKLARIGDGEEIWPVKERSALGSFLLLLWSHFLSTWQCEDEDTIPFPWMTEEDGLQSLQLGLRLHPEPSAFQKAWKKNVMNGTGIYIFPTISRKKELLLRMPDAITALGVWLNDPTLVEEIQTQFHRLKDPVIQEKLSKIENTLIIFLKGKKI